MRTFLRCLVPIFLMQFIVAAEPLRVMSFNIRLPADSDGPNHWQKRKELVVRMILDRDPDIMGTQELWKEQADYISAHATEYVWFGVDRRGGHGDEHMGIFYKRAKLKLLNFGDFWLSDTPEVPASMSWEVSLPRMVTWGLFERLGDGKRFYFFNTHFPHRREDEQARRNAAGVLAERLKALPADVPLIVTGDFNADAGGEVFKTMLTPDMKHSWETAAKRSGPATTSSRFTGQREGRRIDWILYRGDLKVLEAETIDYNEEGRYPSDHYPLLTVFDF